MKRILLVCVEALMNTILYPETSSYRTLFSVDYTIAGTVSQDHAGKKGILRFSFGKRKNARKDLNALPKNGIMN